MQFLESSRGVWLPILAGVSWLAVAAGSGLFAMLIALVPGVLLIGGGILRFASPDPKQGREVSGLAGGIGILLGLPLLLVAGFVPGLLLIGLSIASFLEAGHSGMLEQPIFEDLPHVEQSLGYAAKIGLDEAGLGGMVIGIGLPRSDEVLQIAAEVDEAMSLFESQGWLEKPEDFHRTPLPLEVPRIFEAQTRTRRGTLHYEHLTFDSEYEPRAEEPGRDRWLSFEANRTAHAWMLRHPGPPRPWILCLHGYLMGAPWMDFGLFDPRVFHHKFGLNMMIPTLPLHGLRRRGRISGDGFLAGNFMDSIHAGTQAIWDIRRLISWVRSQEASAIGVYGISLGGHSTALLAGLESGIECAIAGVPVTDFGRIFVTHGPPALVRDFLANGITREAASEVMSVVSPLSMEPKLEPERRAIFGGLGDRIVPTDQVRDLCRHWEGASQLWYAGSHPTFLFEPEVRRLTEQTLESSGVMYAG